jgi:large subunit ribosomal protein L21
MGPAATLDWPVRNVRQTLRQAMLGNHAHLRQARATESGISVYAIVRCGGRQEKASVDDVLTVDKLAGEVGSSVTLPALLVVDDGKVISDAAELGGYQVTAEIVGDAAGPKINMIHYKNKTGYRRRLGHRQKYTQVRITGIGAGSAKPKAASSRKKG